jgi:hypothetical protein
LETRAAGCHLVLRVAVTATGCGCLVDLRVFFVLFPQCENAVSPWHTGAGARLGTAPVPNQPPPEVSVLSKSTDLTGVKATIAAFWGGSGGGIEAVEEAVRAAGVKGDRIINELIPSVPAAALGTTGVKCQRVIAMLRRLAESA